MKKFLLFALIFSCYISYAQPGDLDSSFGTNGVVTADLGIKYNYDNFTTTGSQVLSQLDGTMYILFQEISDQSYYSFIAKRLPNGLPDPSYGDNGFSTPVRLVTPHFAQQADGKIVVAGYNNGGSDLARFNTDGSLDNSFVINEKQTGFLYPNGLVVQKNGKIIVLSSFNTLLRFNTDGSLDNTFSDDGMQDAGIDNYYFNLIVVQNDGKIIVAGSAAAGNDKDNSDFALARFNTDGSLDNTFSNDGKQTTDFSRSYDYAISVAIQGDGKIVVAGSSNIDSHLKFALARYNIDGNLDNTFSGDGKLTTDFDSDGIAHSVAVQSDGKIVVAGGSNGNFAITRYNTDGSLDNTFSGDGKLTTNIGYNAYALSVAIQSDGKIVAIGGQDFFAITRYNKDGSLDNTFDEDGKLTDIMFRVLQGSTFYTCMSVQSDGKIVAAGKTWNGRNYDFALARYNSDGSLDNTFSSDGTQTRDFTGNDDISSIAIQTDGKIVVAGSAVARYNTDGSLDITFGSNGLLTTSFGVSSIALQRNGKIVVAGAVTNGSNYDFALARYNTDGSLDRSFSDDGKQQTDIFIDDFSKSIALQSDGKIVVAGDSRAISREGDEFYFTVTRYNTNGSLDNSFNGNGKQIFNFSFITIQEATSIAIQSDGKIVVAGNRNDNSDFDIARLNHDGTLDNSFRFKGITTFEDGHAYSIALQSDGKILVGGSIDKEGALNNLALVRYNINGSLDNSFSEDGIQTTDVSPGNESITAISIVNDKLYAVGYGEFPGNLGIVARYFLADENKAPAVNISIPDNIIKYTTPARIKINAKATDEDGTITKVRFYSGTTFLHTETVIPYGFLWDNVPAGTYTLTAIAFDNSGNETTSNSIEVSVVDENVPPVVSIVSPVDDTTFTGPATINIIARAKDPNDRISKVEFYNGSALLITEYIYPYTYTWDNVQPGTYTITAKATDDKGLSTISDPVTVTVASPVEPFISSRSSSVISKTNLSSALSLKLSPNPASNTLQIFTSGLQKNKSSTILVLSASGEVIKTIHTTSNQIVQMDVSLLRSGVYFLKILSGDKVLYTQFVKL